MPNFWRIVNEIIREADIILEVLDARMIEETRNEEVENKVKKADKKLIYVLNKCDLVDKKELEKKKKALKLNPCIFVSSTEFLGTTLLRREILKQNKGEPCTVGVLGYPNTGKSSLINALAGRGGAKTGQEAGKTRGRQHIRVDKKILLIDTPGVLPYKQDDEIRLSIIGSKNPQNVKDPDLVAMKIIEISNAKEYYNVEGCDSELILENIGLKLKKMKKGGEVDIRNTSIKIIQDWQKGKIK